MARKDREAKRVKELIDNFDQLLTISKNEHEMFFLGIQTRPPTQKVKDLKRLMREFEEMPLQNTAARFQVRRLRAKFNTYNTLWSRTIKQIEEGTYRRQRFMAKLRQPNANAVADAARVKEEIRSLLRGEEPDLAERTISAEDGIQAATELTARRKRRPAVGAAARGHAIDSPDLMKEYMAARVQVGKSGRIDGDQLRSVLRKQAEAIKARYGVSDVRFRVVAEEGKAKVKAIPVK